MTNHMPSAEMLHAGAGEFPKMIVCDLAHPCNAKCSHCVYTNFIELRRHDGGTPFMKPGLFKKIADEAGQYKAFLRITGAGEPFLHKSILDLVEYAKNKGCKVGIITNGSIMDDDRITRLLNCSLDAIEFSVDAADPETYARIRRGLNFDKLVEHVKRFVQLRNQHKSKTIIMCSIVNQPDTGIDIKGVEAFWKPLVDNVIIRKYLRWGKLPTGNHAYGDWYLDPRHKIPCPIPFDRLFLHVSGEARWCIYDVSTFKVRMGDANTQSIKEIWLSKSFQSYRQYHLDGEWQKIEMCKSCTDYPYRSWNFNYWQSFETAQKALLKT